MKIINCKLCDASFKKGEYVMKISKTGNHFCSLKCSTTYNNIVAPKKIGPPRECKICKAIYVFGKHKHKSKTFCNTCLEQKKMKKTKSNSKFFHEKVGEFRVVNNERPKWLNRTSICAFNRKWNSHLLEYACQVCGYDKHVELAHIKPVSAFDNSETLGTINSENNLLVLCPNHHWEFDKQNLSLLEIPQRTLCSKKRTIAKKKFIKTKSEKTKTCGCGSPMNGGAVKCRKCWRISRRDTWPSKEELQRRVWETPCLQLAKEYGVLDCSINIWCRAYGISKPPRGYWKKKEFGKL